MIGSTTVFLKETDSTNIHALKLIAKQRPAEGQVIVAGFQTQGRGLDANSWESEEGMNLLLSIVLYPSFLPAERQFCLNQAITLGILDFIRREISFTPCRVKWPNDIYVGDRKLCGILIQNSILGNKIDYSVIGIGLNVNQVIFRSPAPNPVSMAMLSGIRYDLNTVLPGLCGFIDKRYSLLKSGEFAAIENDYLQSLYRFGERHSYEIQGKTLMARITGISRYGQLLLEAEKGGKWVCDLKEVKFLI